MPGGKTFACAALLLVCAAFYAEAASFAVQVVQKDLSHDEVRSISVLVEESLMDYLFDRGHIVTNIPAVISSGERDDEDAYAHGLEDAAEGSFEYFVEMVLNYNANSNGPEMNRLSNIKDISWTLTDVRSRKILKSSVKSVEKIMRNEDSEQGIRRFSMGIAQEIETFLKGQRK